MSAFTGISRRNETTILRNWSGRVFASFNPKTDKQNETETSLAVAGYSIVGDIGSNAPYARIHDVGGVITPKTKRLLSWIGESGRVFAKSVTIPARPYFTPAMKKLEIKLDDDIKKYIEKNITQILTTMPDVDSTQFANHLRQGIVKMLYDLKDRIPFTAQAYIGLEMKNVRVNPNWKGVAGG